MALPTIQPVDWPDWGAMPTTSTQNFNVVAVASPGDTVIEQAVGYFSYVMLLLSSDGDGESYQVTLGWYDDSQSEGGNLLGETTTIRVFGQNIVIPMSVWAPYLRITDTGATAYPHNVIGTLVLMAQPPFQTGYPGGVFAIALQNGINNGDSFAFVPNGNAPGWHQAQVVTAATAWDLYLRTWLDPGTFVDRLLADETTPALTPITFIAPPSSWALVITNNDAGPETFTVTATRVP